MTPLSTREFVGAPEYREDLGGLMVYGDAVILYGDEEPDEVENFAYFLEREAAVDGTLLDHGDTVDFLQSLVNQGPPWGFCV